MSKLATLVQRQLKHDAPYAWFLRNQASTGPIFRCKHLAELDNRLESYLTCFQADQTGERSLLAQLNPDDWGSVFIMTMIALRTNDSNCFDGAIAILKEDQQANELSDALCWVSYKMTKIFLDKLLIHENPLARIAAITAVGFLKVKIDNYILESLRWSLRRVSLT